MSRTMDQETHKEFETVERRISRVEAVVESLALNQERVEKSLADLSSEVRNALSIITNNIGAGRLTDWRSLASWAGVILTVVALASSGFIKDIGRIDTKVEALSSNFTEYRLNDQARTMGLVLDESARLEGQLRRETEMYYKLTETRLTSISTALVQIEALLISQRE